MIPIWVGSWLPTDDAWLKRSMTTIAPAARWTMYVRGLLMAEVGVCEYTICQ
jgi:hypothetical protein